MGGLVGGGPVQQCYIPASSGQSGLKFQRLEYLVGRTGRLVGRLVGWSLVGWWVRWVVGPWYPSGDLPGRYSPQVHPAGHLPPHARRYPVVRRPPAEAKEAGLLRLAGWA